MKNLMLPFLNPESFYTNDTPRIFRDCLKDPSQYVTWSDVEKCMNNPWHFRCCLLNHDGRRLELTQRFEVWYENQFPLKEELFQGIDEGLTFTIEQYGHANPAVDNLLENLEARYDCNCDAHIFGNAKPNGVSFGAHWDIPPNLICQIEGTTRWQVFKNRCSSMIRMTDNPYLPDKHDEVLDVAIDDTLNPGDVLYIPSRTYHKPHPGDKRLSMSIPMSFPRDTDSDRRQYAINF